MKNNSFLTRTISGITLVAVLLLVGLLGGMLLLAFCVLVSAVGTFEMYKATGVYNSEAQCKTDNTFAIVGVVLSTLYFIANALLSPILMIFTPVKSLVSGTFFEMFESMDMLKTLQMLEHFASIVIYVVVAFIVFAGIYVFTFPRFDFKKFSFAIVGALYTPVFMTFVYLIYYLSNGKFVFWLIFISSWICDTCAYLVGSSIGKHRLAPVLSPKKSIEGAIGGVIGSAIVGFVFGYFIEYMAFGGENNAMAYVIICSVCAVISQIGDLFASAIKRNFDIKDYGKLIPGHGGILDRFDSVIFIAPVVYMLALLFI